MSHTAHGSPAVFQLAQDIISGYSERVLESAGECWRVLESLRESLRESVILSRARSPCQADEEAAGEEADCKQAQCALV